MRSDIARVSLVGLGILVMVCSVAGSAFAQAPPAPEIDGGTLATGLAGLTAAALILKASRRS